MSENQEPKEAPQDTIPENAAQDSISVTNILDHLFQKSDLVYKFVMVYKDYLSSPHDYGTGEPITSMEAHVTSYIDENPGVSPSELAAYWSRTNGFISQILKKLEAKDMVERVRSPENGKHVLLYTTEKGKQFSYIHKKYDALNVSIFMQRLLETCTAEEIDAFYKVANAYCEVLYESGSQGAIPQN